jgi:Flp pilus assembly protein CpaB
MQQMLSNYRLRNTLVAGGLAVVGALLVFLYISTYRNHVQTGANLVTVLVAKRDLPAGADAGAVAGALRSETVLRRNIVPGAISRPGEIAGLVVSKPILAGEQVTVRQFAPLREQGVLGTISGNLRAIALPGDATQLLYGIVNDGDRVDVVANMKYTLRTGSSGSSTVNLVASRVILRDVGVLQSPTTAGSKGVAAVQTSGTSITLAVTDSQAQKLLFAVKNGDWWLVLRPVAKPTDLPDSVETMQSILGDGLGPAQLDQLTNGQGKGSIGSGQ